MAAQPSTSRESSLLMIESQSRRSSLASNPDIFSDDYALEPIDSNLNRDWAETEDADDTLDDSNFTPYPAIPNRLSVHSRTSAAGKRVQGNDSPASFRDGASQRTLSTSSRFSAVRAQSPYRGPTRPSHPYAMYPQITRASSIASQSTIRHPERPFVHTGGPEHPYSLYPQNTVEDDDEDIGTQQIPLGFAAHGFDSSRGTSNTELGDIVLSDGHIEQLPPYTRYADNIVAKGDMTDVRSTHGPEARTTTSERSSLMPTATQSTHHATVTEETAMISGERTCKATWREKMHKRVCGGIALWLLIVIVALVVLAGLLGGVIGGVVGRRQGVTEAFKGAAFTTWLDAKPTDTGSNTPYIPQGQYIIPFNRTQEVGSCVSQPAYSNSWGCWDVAFLGMTITQDGECTKVQFDDYSVDTTQFLYGPQPPDFNGSALILNPHVDRDNQSLGLAMFFYEQFDKLVILPNEALVPTSQKSVSARDVHIRGLQWEDKPLLQGDKPWFCFWNGTISEFWIYQDQSSSNETTLTSSVTSSTSMVPPTPPPSSSSDTYQSWKNKAYLPSYQNTWYHPSTGAAPEPTSDGSGYPRQKRSYISPSPYHPKYPRLVKMIEKRLPTGNVQPYCQEMQVLNDWNIVPREGGRMILIEEAQWSSDPITGGSRKRGATTELESNCVCEWIST